MGRRKICGLVLSTEYQGFADTSKIEILGKTMLDWVKLSLSDDFFAAAPYSQGSDIFEIIKNNICDSEITVVLFSDTPLITRKTVLDAVFELENSKENGFALTRGFCLKTDCIQKITALSALSHRYFEEEDFLTAFSFKQTAMVAEVLKNRIITYHMGKGVQFDDPATAYIGCDTVIEKGAVIGEMNTVKGASVIRAGVKLLRGNVIENGILDENCTVINSVIENSYIGKNTKVGPWAHIREYSKIGDACRIGNFVEIKNSAIGDKSKLSHHAYAGDATVGANCNIGCGTVFCNYDGKNKHRTEIGDNTFIGSNTNLIAPLKIGANAFIAAGSTINKDVPDGAFAIARERQTIKTDWKKQ